MGRFKYSNREFGELLLRNLWVIVRWGVLATPRRGGRALPVWLWFEVFREWIDHAFDETLRRKWEAPTNGVGIPATYSQLDAGDLSPRPAVTL